MEASGLPPLVRRAEEDLLLFELRLDQVVLTDSFPAYASKSGNSPILTYSVAGRVTDKTTHQGVPNVVVTVGDPAMKGILAVNLPRTVHWGKPASIPVPPGMDEPKKAATTGQAHSSITVTPRHTATASAWFLNNGNEVICMRLSGEGHLQMLRWRRSTGRWCLV